MLSKLKRNIKKYKINEFPYFVSKNKNILIHHYLHPF